MKKFNIILLAVVLIFAVAGFARYSQTPASNMDNASPEKAITQTNVSNSTTDVISNSYSARDFIEKEVDRKDLETVLQSGLKAPSARNLQPWHFTVVTNPETAVKLVKDAAKGSVVIVVSGKTENQTATFDCGLAVQNMYITAQSLGLGARIYISPVRNINENEKEALKIPAGFDAVAVICVGHIANQTDALSSASKRKPLSEIVNYIK